MTRRLTDAQTACRLSRPGFSLLRFVPNFAQLMTAAVPSPPSWSQSLLPQASPPLSPAAEADGLKRQNKQTKKTHRYTRGNLLLALWALSLSVGPVVFWRLLVRTPAALCLPVPRALMDDVEQVKRILVLSVRALGLTPLVAVLAGGVVSPAKLYAGAQTLHYGVVQLRYRWASGSGHHRSIADPTGHSSQADTQHGYECPCCRLSRGRFSHARRSPTSLSRLRSTELIMDHSMGMEDNKTCGLSCDPCGKEKKRLYCAHKVTWEKGDSASDIWEKIFRSYHVEMFQRDKRWKNPTKIRFTY